MPEKWNSQKIGIILPKSKESLCSYFTVIYQRLKNKTKQNWDTIAAIIVVACSIQVHFGSTFMYIIEFFGFFAFDLIPYLYSV